MQPRVRDVTHISSVFIGLTRTARSTDTREYSRASPYAEDDNSGSSCAAKPNPGRAPHRAGHNSTVAKHGSRACFTLV